jgi:alcohol dehydrogenase (cytochrome c)
VALALVVLAAASLLAACGGSGSTSASLACTTVTGGGAGSTATGSGSWPDPNGGVSNSRVAAGSGISSANVSKLAQAWTFPITAKTTTELAPGGMLAANPIVQNGVVYLQDLASNVYALDLASGKLRWEYRCSQPVKSGPGPNGVAVANGDVYGLTNTAAFALNATTGRAVWVDHDLLSKDQGTFGIQPQADDGRVYLASQYGSGPGGGVVIALNASSGAVLWKFNTVTGPEPGPHTLGLGAGGAWETPLVGNDGSVTFGIGNPYQTPAEAIAHPSVDLYTDSDVNLDANTGKLRWYYQGLQNDFEDHDLQASPISARVGTTPVVIGGGKLGYVVEMNATTGKLLWRTPVGEHNAQENDPVLALHHELTLKGPFTILPGPLGGILTNMAVAGNSVYVATLNVPLAYKSVNAGAATEPGGAVDGELEALNLISGKVEWATKVPTLPLGAATVSNNLVLTTLYDGQLIALNRKTGAIVYRHKLPTSTNAPIAIAGKTVIVPAGGPITSRAGGGGSPQVVAYTLP